MPSFGANADPSFVDRFSQLFAKPYDRLLLYFPALVVAMVLVFKIIRPKYARKSGAVMTLF